MSLAQRILASLAAGLICGLLIARLGDPGGVALPAAETVGQAWVGGLRITIVPLVFALIVTGIASAADTARAGGVAARALLFITCGLVASALVSGLVVQGLLSIWPVATGALGQLGVTTEIVPAQAATISREWLLGFIPTNPIKAAAEGEMVPLVVFALLFGFAATRIDRSRCTDLLAWFQSVVDTLMVIVQWVLWLAPIGVFALALAAGARAGLSAAGALAHYVAIIVIACAVVTLLVYPIIGLTRIGIVRFARAAAPAQVIAFSTQSSIASLPAMIEATKGPLAVAAPVRDLVLPMAVSIFRVTSAAANFAVALYLAALHGIAVGLALFIVGVRVATVVSLAAVGLPSQVSFFTAIGPVCLALGVPVELLPLLLAVETIPDTFRTVGNVTADVALTAIVGVTRTKSAGDRWM